MMQIFAVDKLLKEGTDRHRKAMEAQEKTERQRLWNEAENIYNSILNQIGEDQTTIRANVLYLLGTMDMTRNWYERGAIMLELATQAEPTFFQAWNNLGICRKNQWDKQRAGAAFRKAIEIDPETADYWSNWAGCYINEGKPERCLELANKALEVDPNHVQGRWHKALALLELQRFEEAWEHHEARLNSESNCNVAVRNYADEGVTPWWDGKSDGLIAIHGEQGLGDEIMFASCIPDLMKEGREFVFESSPRTADLFARSLPCKVVGTHKLDGSEWKGDRKVDFKVGVGSLAKYCRNTEEDFPGIPYLVPNPKYAKQWKKKFAQLSDKPKIGIAWQGGMPTTRVDLRSIPLFYWTDVLDKDVTWVSLQYTKAAAEEVAAVKEHIGVNIHHWGEVAHAKNLDEYASLISELDLVISVCQTAIHISGGLGVECWCLTPSAPAWRYGVKGNMPWYNSVDLMRQEKGEDWGPLMGRVSQRLENWIDQRKLSRTESKVA